MSSHIFSLLQFPTDFIDPTQYNFLTSSLFDRKLQHFPRQCAGYLLVTSIAVVGIDDLGVGTDN